MRPGVEILIALLVAAIPLIALARRAGVSYPIVLVLAGLLLGFIPGLPVVRLDPNLVLLVFLPPLLYWESVTAPTDVMLANSSQIWTLAIGLVVATTVVVAVAAHALIPQMSWAAAFVLGAIVAPTDELAAAPVLQRFRLPRHVVAIVEGESLVNDASSLIIYAAAIGAAVTGAFSLGQTLVQFAAAAVASFVIGLAAGRLAVEGWRRIKDTQLQGVISVVLPFLAYVPAQRFGLSGVLAVVTAGVYVNRYTPALITPAARLRGIGFWENFVFLANAVLFLIVGLQLHELAQATFARNSWTAVLWYAVVVNAAVIAVRFGWVMLAECIPTFGGSSEHPTGDFKHAFIVAWSGLRGAVSLAAALAIPVTVAGGARFPHRELIVFITFTVICVTLVGGGLTLPLVVRRFAANDEADEEDDELQHALRATADAAIERIAQLEREGRLRPNEARGLRKRYDHRHRLHQTAHDRAVDEEMERLVAAEREVLAAERGALLALRARGEIDNVVLRDLQLALDLTDSRLSHGDEHRE